MGYQQVLDGSGSGAKSQTFTATSTNPDIKVTVATGPFITLTVNHTPANSNDITITNETLTYQLFSDLTPDATNRVNSVITSGQYNNSTIYRIAGDFAQIPGPAGFVVQGGPNLGGTSPLELNQQLAFLQPGTVAIPRGTAANTDGTDFFITTGPQTVLNYSYSIYGQLVAGYNTLSDLTKVATGPNAGIPGENSSPLSPVNITSAVSSTTNPDGVLHIDATGAKPGETATITVTAFDPSTNTMATQSFPVYVIPPSTTVPTTATFPPTTTQPPSQAIATGQTATFNLSSNANNPTNNTGITTSYAIVTNPTNGTATVNTGSNTITYTPNSGFQGTDTFSYRAINNNSTTSANPASANGNTVTVSVTVAPAVSHIVRVVGNVMVVTPPPGTAKQSNVIDVTEPSGSAPSAGNLVVTLNGVPDAMQPAASTIKQIVVFGSKASNAVTVDPSVNATIPVTLDAGHGHGTYNVLKAGAGTTREHAWFGKTQLYGGTGANQLIGRAGHVKFVPTTTSNEIFAGVPRAGYTNFQSYNGRTEVRINPPGGRFYVYRNGKLHQIPTPHSHQVKQS
jgi:cyclophilin family peptidyl-prolyl cis-trans isomerase